jgi:hypothetical protein
LGGQPIGTMCTALIERPHVLRKRRVSRIDESSDGMMTVTERKEEAAVRVRNLDTFVA